MEIDPEDVKAEIAAVKVAFAQVNARLGRGRAKPGGARPNILSRVSKAAAPATGDRQQQPGRSYAEFDRRSSRRFVNRDWNIARKRTAEGLFVDDQEGAACAEDGIDPASTRGHDSGPKIQLPDIEARPVDEGAGFQSHRKGHQAPYNPFKEANHPSGYVEPQPGKAGMRHAGDEATRSGRAFDQSRISFASHSQHRENRHSDRARWPSRENESVAAQDLPSVGHKRHATFDARSEAKLRRNDQAAHVQQTSKPMEDGELEAHAPGQPLPQEEFMVEKRPDRQVAVPDKVLQRNRRMFGALLGHLDGAERQEKKFEQSAVMKRRKELEEHAAERARIDSMQAREADRRRQFEARRKDIATKRELLLQQNMKQAKLLCAEKIAYARGLLQFIRTETIPPILWEPAGVNSDVEKLFEQQAQDFKSWAAEQLDKLRLDQQGMRERAEKQWAEIDHIREERHNANIGKWKGGVGPAKVTAKAVRSSVMTAKDYRERAQQSRQTDLEVDAREQAGQEDDHAADDAEAHDETYLIPDAENAASEATDEPGKGTSQVQRSATPERHTGTDAIAVADGEANFLDQVHDVAMSPKRNSNDAEPKSSSQQAHNKSGTIGPSVAFMEAGNNSDDSLSLSE